MGARPASPSVRDCPQPRGEIRPLEALRIKNQGVSGGSTSRNIGARLAPSHREHHVYRTTILLLVLTVAGAQNANLACDACCYMQTEPACPHGDESVAQQLVSPQGPCSSDSASPAIGPGEYRGSLHDSSDAGVPPVDSASPWKSLTHFNPVRASTRRYISPQSPNLRI